MKKRKNAFTLVELLAVIIILAVILVIAVPKVISIIEDIKKGTLVSTAKLIASSAEKAKVQNQVLGKDKEITCENVAKLNNEDYERCSIEFDSNNKAYVDIKGSGKFEDMYVCKGTKDEAHIVDRCPNEKVKVELQLNTEEEFNDISGIYKEGDVLYLDTPTKQDFTFLGWEVVKGDSVLEEGNKLTVGEFDTIVYAKWENNPLFEVDLDGGSDNIDYKERYASGTIIDLEVPTKENHKFVRWERISGNGDISGNTFTMGTEDVVIKAIWELNVFSLTVEPNGGVITQEFKTEYAVGETITLEIPTRTGYTFTGWTVTNGSVNNNTFTMGNSDAVLTANWEINTYNISYELDGGTNATGNPTSGIYGSTVEISNPTKTNHTFKGWNISGDGAVLSGTNLTIGAGNIILTAIWEEYPSVEIPTQSGTLTYSGSAQSPAWSNYDSNKITIGGTTSGTNAGTYSATFTPKDGYMWKDKTTTAKTVSWSIGKAAGSLSISASSGTINGLGGTTTFTVNRAGNGKISVSSSNTGVATVSISGTTVTITSKGYGTATITVSVAAGTNHKAPSNKTYTINVDYLYLYKSGNTYDSVTGGWKVTQTNGNGAANLNSDHMYVESGNSATGAWYTEMGFLTSKKIDLSNYTKLHFKGYCEWGITGGSYDSGTTSWGMKFGVYDLNGTALVDGGYRTKFTNFDVTVDVSALSGESYIKAAAYSWTDVGAEYIRGKGKYTEIYLE